MFLFGIFSLTLVLVSQRPGVHAESNLSSKFQFSSAKEQNGKKSFCVGLCVLCCLGRYTKESEQSVLGKEESLRQEGFSFSSAFTEPQGLGCWWSFWLIFKGWGFSLRNPSLCQPRAGTSVKISVETRNLGGIKIAPFTRVSLKD